jgi:CheY-like chemotaxis protein
MPRVLLIDDDKPVRTTITLALEKQGFEVVAAESGRAGLREFENSNFDLLIVDIFMPDMDGVKTIKALRQRNPQLPVIAISGVLLRASARTALDFFPMLPDLGGVTCLQKPFRPSELLKIVNDALGAPLPA